MAFETAAGLLALLGVVATGASAAAACRVQQMEIPVRIVDTRPVAILKVNGVDVQLLVDSGADHSSLSATTAAQLKLPLSNLPFGMRIHGYTGEIEAKRTRVDKLGLLGAELSDIEFLVGGNQIGAGIQGILGRNILAAGDTEYDLAHGAVRLSFPKGDCSETILAHWAGEAPVIRVPMITFDRKDSAVRLDVRINGQRIEALMDTGALRTALTLKAARRAGIQDAELTRRGWVGGGGEGRARSWTGLVASFELGGQKIENNRLQIDEVDRGDQGMLIGMDYFLSHRIYVSRLQKQIYITWNGTPVFAQGATGTAEYDQRYAAVPKEVASDDADALARRGAAALAAKQWDRALADLNRAIELEPAAAQHRELRARVHLARRSPRPALADLDEALAREPTAPEARLMRAGLRAGLGDRAGASADLQQLDAALPAHADQRAEMGQWSARLGQHDEALRQYDLWIKSHPLDAKLPSILNASCRLRLRWRIDLPMALEQCKQAVAKDRDEPAHQESLGWIHLLLGDDANARRAFDAAIKLKPQAMSLYGRSLAHRRLGDAEKAEADLAAARQLDPAIEAQVTRLGLARPTEPAKP